MRIKINMYGYKKCSTVKKAVKYLESNNVEFDFIETVDKPISQNKIKEICSLCKSIDELINPRSSVYRELKLQDKIEKMNKADKIKLLAQNPKLIKRPIIVKGKTIILGFDEEKYEKLVSRKKTSTKKTSSSNVTSKKSITKKSNSSKVEKANSKKADSKKTTNKKVTTKKEANTKTTKVASKTTKKVVNSKTTKASSKKTTSKKSDTKKSNNKKSVK